MRRIDHVAREAKRALGVPGPGAEDDAFLGRLAAARSRRRRRDRAIAAGLASALLVVAWAAWPRGIPERITPAELPTRAARAVPPPRSDPMAALLLEAARIRLDGIGDPAVARLRLREVIEDFPGTDSAAEAEKLLEKLEGSDG